MPMLPTTLTYFNDTYKILTWFDSVPKGYEQLNFDNDTFWATQFMQRFASDWCSMQRLRSLLANSSLQSLHRLNDQQVLQKIAAALQTRQLRLYRQEIQLISQAITPANVTEVATASPQPPVNEDAGLSLTIRTESGEVVSDEFDFELVDPNGAIESVNHNDGLFHKPKAAKGNHRARFKYLHQARWVAPSMYVGGVISMCVATPGFKDGTELVFKVYHSEQAQNEEALAQIKAKVANGEAKANWQHCANNNAMPLPGNYIFEVEVGHKWASSNILRVAMHPATQICGIKERLAQLGYLSDDYNDKITAELTDALQQFQQSMGMVETSGEVNAATIYALEGLGS